MLSAICRGNYRFFSRWLLCSTFRSACPFGELVIDASLDIVILSQVRVARTALAAFTSINTEVKLDRNLHLAHSIPIETSSILDRRHFKPESMKGKSAKVALGSHSQSRRSRRCALELRAMLDLLRVRRSDSLFCKLAMDASKPFLFDRAVLIGKSLDRKFELDG